MHPYLPDSVLRILHDDRMREFGYPCGDRMPARARRPSRRRQTITARLARIPHLYRRLCPVAVPGMIAEDTRISLDALAVVPGDADERPVLGRVFGDVGGRFGPPLRDPDQSGLHEGEAVA
jgi:hypothetical protein